MLRSERKRGRREGGTTSRKARPYLPRLYLLFPAFLVYSTPCSSSSLALRNDRVRISGPFPSVGKSPATPAVSALCPACRPPPLHRSKILIVSSSSARLPKIHPSILFPFRVAAENNPPRRPVIDYSSSSSRPFFRPPEVFRPTALQHARPAGTLSSRILDWARNSCPRSITRPRLIDEFICIGWYLSSSYSLPFSSFPRSTSVNPPSPLVRLTELPREFSSLGRERKQRSREY